MRMPMYSDPIAYSDDAWPQAIIDPGHSPACPVICSRASGTDILCAGRPVAVES